MNKLLHLSIIKTIILIFIGYLSVIYSLKQEPYASGDAPEYLLMTEALVNHSSPDIKPSDVETFFAALTDDPEKIGNYKPDVLLHIKTQAEAEPLFMRESFGIFTAKNHKHYSYHFFFYSLLNVPGRMLTKALNKDPLKGFMLTNAFMVILTCGIILFLSPFNVLISSIIAFIFLYSSHLWYLGWVGSEVFSACFITIGAWLYFQKRYYSGIFFTCIAALQNQPIALLALFMCIHAAIDYRFQIKKLLKIAASAVIVFWPSIFYYLNFGTTNIIKDKGFLSTDYITFTRVFGFYFDLNQGLILAAPLMLFLYLFLLGNRIRQIIARKSGFSFDLLIPLVLIAITMVVSTMINWNHGMAVVNRYVTFILPVILIHFVYLLSPYKLKFQVPVFLFVLTTQVATSLYHNQEKFNKWDWAMAQHKPVSKYVIEHFPALYNPDPIIFITRTNGIYNYSPEVSPVIYQKKDGTIPKMLVHKDKLAELKEYGIKVNEGKKLQFVTDWAYLNKGDFTLLVSEEKVKENIFNMHRAHLILKMQSSPYWYQTIEEKAEARGIPVEEMLRLDAEYILSIEEEKK